MDKRELQDWLHREVAMRDKLLCILASFDEPCQIKDVRRQAAAAGFRIPRGCNPSATLSRAKGYAVRLPEGWQLTEAGTRYLRDLLSSEDTSEASDVVTNLREELKRLEPQETHAFVEEAIAAYENGLYRAAIVMSWVGAIAILQQHVFANHLRAFNAEARRVDAHWRTARSVDGLSRMRDSDFLDRLVALSVIGKDVKTELGHCLARRNSCGHPNSLRVGANTVTHHLEVLLLNVFDRF